MSNGTEPSLLLGINEHQDVVLGQKFGYARVSSVEQNLDRQLDQLLAAGASQIYKEKVSGSARHRPSWRKCCGIHVRGISSLSRAWIVSPAH